MKKKNVNSVIVKKNKYDKNIFKFVYKVGKLYYFQ